MSSRDQGRITPDAARTLRRDLKTSLSAVASGRAGVASLLHEIERIAKYTSGDHRATLGGAKAKGDLRALVSTYAPSALRHSGPGEMGWDRLYKAVTTGRNDVAHTGTEGVLAKTRTMALAAVLLEALLGALEDELKLSDVMVANPVCAHGWQTVADVRRAMLMTDFSELPLSGRVEEGGKWQTVTARGLAAYLAPDGPESNRLGETVDRALCDRPRPLELHLAPTACQGTPVSKIWNGGGEPPDLPIMVVTEEAGGRPVLVGIVTAFDLL